MILSTIDASTVGFNSITFITSLGSLITAIAALVTIREIRKSREATIYPDLILESTEYPIFAKKDGDYFFPTIDNRNKVIREGSLSIYEPTALNVRNIGLGIAKTIRIQIEDTTATLIESIWEKTDTNTVRVLKTDGTISINFPKYKVDWGFANFEGQYEAHQQEYILPEKHIYGLAIPDVLIRLWLLNHYISLDAFVTKTGKQRHLNTEHSFDVRLSYEDLAGKRYGKIYKVAMTSWRTRELYKIKEDTDNSISELQFNCSLKSYY